MNPSPTYIFIIELIKLSTWKYSNVKLGFLCRLPFNISLLIWERQRQWFVVPLIYAYIGWFVYVPCLGVKPATFIYRDDIRRLCYRARALPAFFYDNAVRSASSTGFWKRHVGKAFVQVHPLTPGMQCKVSHWFNTQQLMVEWKIPYYILFRNDTEHLKLTCTGQSHINKSTG